MTRRPVRAHLRPKPLRPVLRAADVPPDLLRAFPKALFELNAVTADVWLGDGQPGPGWDGWNTQLLWLDEALALALAGEA